MITRSHLGTGRRQFLCACCGATFIAWTHVEALAADEVEVVPVTQEPRHHVRFENEYLTIVEAIFLPGEQSLFHKHVQDSVLIVGPQKVRSRIEKLNDTRAAILEAAPGDVNFADWQDHPVIHRVTNLDEARTSFLFDCEIHVPKPGLFAAPDRSAVPVYASVLDNARAHAWRLRLGPGESAAAIAQSGPGVRVVIAGSRIRETVQGESDHDLLVQPGHYEWQPAGRTRAITNTGNVPLDLVEFEIK